MQHALQREKAYTIVRVANVCLLQFYGLENCQDVRHQVMPISLNERCTKYA